eukprot:CAMPEP_0168516006 /NCGR_PEP_ID=MMETSP0405-20121227/5146_1 /TAXON_ID=498012 /ORGANISM="Trichosphaerium sp, Strain Am-I-7 wt" /LENGTH=218 /DNA_ID=CAMNT_0008535637 /DNA_START=267 /DNA_END=920 /DNA_ORIENTATION=+
MHVFGTGTDDKVYSRLGITNLERAMLEVAVDTGNTVYGLTHSGDLYVMKNDKWLLVKSKLEAKGITVCNDVIWGVGDSGALTRINSTQNPSHITSYAIEERNTCMLSVSVSQVSCNQGEEFPWFVSNGVLYNQCTTSAPPTAPTAPTQIPTTLPTTVTPTTSPPGYLWHYTLGQLRMLSATNDGKLWGVGTNDIVYHWDNQWTYNLELAMLEVAVDTG